MKPIRTAIFGLCLCLLLLATAGRGQAEVSVNDPPIYDEKADGSQQIKDALAVAAREHKRVLIQFGANWCIWCHRLHHTFETDPEVAEVLKRNYVVVLVDVNEDHNAAVDAKYGHPTQLGLPVLVVLDSDGTQLTTEDSSKLEEGKGHSPAKILDFLKTESWPEK
jgi:thiol:disulfide interchange protein